MLLFVLFVVYCWFMSFLLLLTDCLGGGRKEQTKSDTYINFDIYMSAGIAKSMQVEPAEGPWVRLLPDVLQPGQGLPYAPVKWLQPDIGSA